MLQVYTRHSMKGENYRNFQVEISQSGKDPPPTLPVVEIEGNNPAGEMNFYFYQNSHFISYLCSPKLEWNFCSFASETRNKLLNDRFK